MTAFTVDGRAVSGGSSTRRRLSTLAVLLAVVLAAHLATPTRAAAAYITPMPGMQVGFDGGWTNAHVWLKVTDRAAMQAGSQAAASLACNQIAPGTGAACSIAVKLVWERVNPAAYTNHGTWVEVYPWPYRTYVGRW